MLIPFPTASRLESSLAATLVAHVEEGAVGVVGLPGRAGEDEVDVLDDVLAASGADGARLARLLGAYPGLFPWRHPGALSEAPAPMDLDEVLDRLREELEDCWPLLEGVGEGPVRTTWTAQVHLASLRGGDVVAVRVRRPGALAELHADLDLVTRLRQELRELAAEGDDPRAARALHRALQVVERDRVAGIDLRNWARAAESLSKSLGPVPDLDVRRPAWPLVSAHAMAVHQPAGVWLEDLSPGSSQDTADALLVGFLHQLLVTGLVHPTASPGGVLVDTDGGLHLDPPARLLYLDGRERDALLAYLSAMVRADAARAIESVVRLGAPLGDGAAVRGAIEGGLDRLDHIQSGPTPVRLADLLAPVAVATGARDDGGAPLWAGLVGAAREVDLSLEVLEPGMGAWEAVVALSDGAAGVAPEGPSDGPEPTAPPRSTTPPAPRSLAARSLDAGLRVGGGLRSLVRRWRPGKKR